MSGLGSSTQPQIAVSEVPLTKLEGGVLCPASSKWTAKYVVTKASERIFEVAGVSFERELPLSGFIESETE